MSDCDLIQVHLAARASGEELGETGELVRRHLARCPACRREAERLEATGRHLRGTLLTEPVPEEAEVDWDRFRAGILSRTVGRGGEHWPSWWKSAALAGAAAILVLALALPLFLRDAGPGGGDRADRDRTVTAPRGGRMEIAGSGAPDLLRGIETARTREEVIRFLHGGRNLLVGLAASPVFCSRDRRDVAVERDVSLALLRRKQTLDPALARPALGRSRQVCDDLERALRLVSSLGDCPAPREVRDLLRLAAERDLLTRIDAALQGLGEEGGRRV